MQLLTTATTESNLMTTPPTPRHWGQTLNARLASARLNMALLTIAAQGLRTPCSQPETHSYWTSEHVGERQLAMLWCGGCPVFEPCGDAAEANKERWGVWSSKDYGDRSGVKAAA
jgi:hypothetical protein